MKRNNLLEAVPYERVREVYRPDREDHTRFTLLHARYLAAYRESLKVLSQPVPDTFLGRKTHEPFPICDPDA
ncbi:hypothetical protein JQ631_10025 [Bradyrhizobium manausense]|uniref:hypothetical protein n=1 Tax=Bradyrhizobium manausense TaxID=989370 RepID=UPI001BAD4950|nr:hypothetical protein [Bradyrhizobium manausense]MBR0789407.1 hypothetical protein [Bradyrhizobium manausense]